MNGAMWRGKKECMQGETSGGQRRGKKIIFVRVAARGGDIMEHNWEVCVCGGGGWLELVLKKEE